MQGRALVVATDPDHQDQIGAALRSWGLDVTESTSPARSGADAHDAGADLVVLDLEGAQEPAAQTCRRIRAVSDAAVLVVGADDVSRRLDFLRDGADAYLAGPLSTELLHERVAPLLARSRSRAGVPPRVVDLGAGLVLVMTAELRASALLDGTPLPFTASEVALLLVLADQPGRPVSRAELREEVWRGQFGESGYLVDVHVGSVRRKLRRSGSPHRWIDTVDGSSYVFVAPTES